LIHHLPSSRHREGCGKITGRERSGPSQSPSMPTRLPYFGLTASPVSARDAVPMSARIPLAGGRIDWNLRRRLHWFVRAQVWADDTIATFGMHRFRRRDCKSQHRSNNNTELRFHGYHSFTLSLLYAMELSEPIAVRP
jgi:hypothetical protein